MHFEASMAEMIHTTPLTRFLAFTAHASFRHAFTRRFSFALNDDASAMTEMHFGQTSFAPLTVTATRTGAQLAMWTSNIAARATLIRHIGAIGGSTTRMVQSMTACAWFSCCLAH